MLPAAFIVKEMPLEMLRWLVVAVVSYAGVTLLLSAARTPKRGPIAVAKAVLLD